ncbi:MAG: DUF6362 family protein [Burkholderiaceae bacterium]
MTDPRSVWSCEDVAIRFQDAVTTGRRLPPVRVQGYFNAWPTIVRQEWERFADNERVIRLPPSPVDVERMLEAMGWVQWLEVEQRHLVWMRADNYEWNEIGRRFGCCRTTAWRHWKSAMEAVAEQLNGG